MSDDIVALLRTWSRQAAEQGVAEVTDGLLAAADEIERLRAELVSTTNKLTAERDEARRSYCRAFVDIFPNPKYEELDLEDAAIDVAKEFGWKCFKEAGR